MLPFRQTPRVTADDNHGTVSNNVPLPESTSGLEWSSLVSVATKAIEGIFNTLFRVLTKVTEDIHFGHL